MTAHSTFCARTPPTPSGRRGATLFTLGLLAAIALLPLALVWKRLGPRARQAVLAAHLLGLAAGLLRYLL